jgi:hypothetical protein
LNPALAAALGVVVLGAAPRSAPAAALDGREVPVEGPGGDFVEVALERSVACGRTAGGDVWCWQLRIDAETGGLVPAEKLAVPWPVQQVVVTGTCACLRSAQGALWCWQFEYARYGMDSPYLLRPPVRWADAAPFSVNVGPDTGVASLAAAGGIVCARLDSGEVACAAADAPRQLVRLPGVRDAAALAMSASRACVVHRRGRVGCFVAAQLVRQGRADMVPHPQIADATAVAVADTFACAWRRGGPPLCWGDGALPGAGEPTPRRTVAAPLPEQPQAVGAAGGRVCALDATTLVCQQGRERTAHAGVRAFALAPQAACWRVDAGTVCSGTLLPYFAASEGRRYPGDAGTFNVRSALGVSMGRGRVTPEIAVRADMLLGEPRLDRAVVRAGPAVEVRALGAQAVDAAAAVRLVASLYDGLAVGLTPAVGYASRGSPLRGTFVALTLSVGVRAPLADGHPSRYGPAAWLFAFDVGPYVSLRRALATDALCLSAGFESAPSALGAALFAWLE